MTAIERSTFYSRRIRKTRREIIVPVTQSIGNVVSSTRDRFIYFTSKRRLCNHVVWRSRMIREPNRIHESSRKLCVYSRQRVCVCVTFSLFFFPPLRWSRDDRGPGTTIQDQVGSLFRHPHNIDQRDREPECSRREKTIMREVVIFCNL